MNLSVTLHANVLIPIPHAALTVFLISCLSFDTSTPLGHFPSGQSSSFPHLFPLSCGVDVSYETHPSSSVLSVLPGQFSLGQVVPDAIRPPPLWSSSPSFPRHLHRHHSLAYVFVFSSQYSPVANMTHLVFLYKVFFPTVSKSLFSADSKSDCSQTQKVERFSKNR